MYNPHSNIGNHFGILLDNPMGSNVCLIWLGKRLMLTRWCWLLDLKYFEPYFLKAERWAMLHFAYTNTLVEDEELVGSSSSSCVSSTLDTFAGKLLIAANTYVAFGWVQVSH